MPIDPGTKNWTWVLERVCPDCGFDSSAVDYDDIPDLIRADVERWEAVLRREDAAVRPDDSTWSALEYAAHVRDAHRIFRTRLALVLTEDDPEFANWDQDATALAEDYNAQNPAEVASELGDAARALADDFAAVPPGIGSGPVDAAAGRISRSNHWPPTTFTTLSIICGTCGAEPNSVELSWVFGQH